MSASCTVKKMIRRIRTAAKLERARPLGLDVGIVTSRHDFAHPVTRETAGAGVHAVLDLVGAGALAGNLKALAPRGRLVLVRLLAGREAHIDLGALLRKWLTIVAITLRSRPLEEKIATTELFHNR